MLPDLYQRIAENQGIALIVLTVLGLVAAREALLVKGARRGTTLLYILAVWAAALFFFLFGYTFIQIISAT